MLFNAGETDPSVEPQQNPNSVRNIAIRIGVTVAIVVLINIVPDFVSSYTNCGGSRVQNWLDGTGTRVEEADLDWQASQDFLTVTQFRPLVKRAEQRYQAQLDESPPSCLSFAQETAIELFDNDQLALEQIYEGDQDKANEYGEIAYAALQKLSVELDYLSDRYGWTDE